MKLEVQGTPSALDAVDPAEFDQHQHTEHSQVNFLNLYIAVVYSPRSADFDFRVYCKPGTANT